MARFNKNEDYFEMWFEDKNAILNTMVRNLQADLEAGYDYFGNSVTNQRKAIEEYKEKFDNETDTFKTMSIEDANRWCFYDMKKRGAIE